MYVEISYVSIQMCHTRVFNIGKYNIKLLIYMSIYVLQLYHVNICVCVIGVHVENICLLD